jgi:glycosyltransferase involved in cell wall biosynthesis
MEEHSDNVHLSIVVPLYNEQESVDTLVARIAETAPDFGHSFELILVDDGSTDATWVKIMALGHGMPQLRGIKFRRNFGQTAAMVAGIEYAMGEIIVTMDGDLQNDPADIPKLLEMMEQGYDIVSGWRKDRKDHWSRVIPSKIANALISWTTGVKLHDYGCSLKAYRAECIRSIQAYGEMHRFFPALVSMTGARITEIPVQHYPRQHGVSKYGFNRIFKVFSDIIAINLIIKFSSLPLKGFAVLSLPFLFLSLFLGTAAILGLMLNWSAGKPMFFLLSSVLSVTAVVHLLALGVLAELIIGTSDLQHTSLPEITMKTLQKE